MDVFSLKIIFVVVIFLAGLVGGWIPLRRRSGEGARRLLQRGDALAAGILLGIGLVHMLPDANAYWRELTPGYPTAFVLASLAFLLILFFEHVLLPPHEHGIVEGIGHGRSELADELGAHARSGPSYAYTLLVALSIHSIIAGIALGAQRVIASALAIFLAIIAHKSTAGFALGVSLARNEIPRSPALGMVVVFATATPLGIAIGSVTTDLLGSRSARIFDAVFLSLAAGTFIYIAALDIIGEEFAHGGDRGVKWWLATGGLGLTALLAVWI